MYSQINTNALNQLRNRLLYIENEMRETCKRCGRARKEITLLAVSKYVPDETVIMANTLGLKEFAENRIELFTKRKELEIFKNCTWHMIGNIQSRKINKIVGEFSLIHSIDSFNTAKLVSKAACEKNICQPVLLQINTSGEESKQGFIVDSKLLNRDNIYLKMNELMQLPGIRIQGLMTMAPNIKDENFIREVFYKTRITRDRLQELYPNLELRHLSMGMSNDFKLAIEEGATIIRIGTRLFIK